jgi:hypothetical protein
MTRSNQVTYPDAFTDFKADLVCTYRRGGFESDVVFRQQPPTPDQYGLDNANSQLQMVTEFFNTTDPQPVATKADQHDGLQDSTLKFGKLKMIQGKAFAIQTTNAQKPSVSSPMPVYKHWLHLAGRTILIEAIPLKNLADDLGILPQAASLPHATPGIAISQSDILHQASHPRRLPSSREFLSDTNQILIAAADLNKQPGVVLDYNEVDYATDFTFQAGMTYYVSDWFSLDGTTTFEGGAIIKFTEAGNGSQLDVCDVVCATDAAHPLILTSKNDDSIGEQITGSTGVPTPGGDYCGDSSYYASSQYYLWLWNNGTDLKHVRFKYAGFALSGTVSRLEDVQFLHCVLALCQANPNLHNVLFSDCGGVAGDGDQVTVNNCDSFSGLLTNSIVRGTNDPEIFQSGVSGDFYLSPDSSYINAGNVTAGQVGLYYYTTQTNQSPELNSTVDLGYHYLALDTNGNPVSTLVSGVPDYIADSDGNGLPDAWEIKYFGQTGLDPNSDLDGDGNTLLYDFQNGIDPNVIAFNIESTNDYVNTTTANVQVNITAGAPGYYAIFANQTTTTNWLPFTTTNLTVSLGTTDGVYNVVVGLKGLPTDATQTWGTYGFTLDRVPPVVTVTNPILSGAIGTVIKPYVQLQGAADEPLASLSYDISNALGFATNQNAFVTDQGFDTNKFDFTTNYFQAYDVPLATNDNIITLRAVDRAGNITTTNINLVLDYTTATNPPAVRLIWPLDGMAVSGTSITMRGTMSDETGTIMAQVVNGDGTTNTIAGLVERNHMFWVENVPLNGTNQISIQATDAAGNVTTTNFTVIPGSLTLTIDSTPTGDDLYQPNGRVSGTVSDPTAEVTVNGVTAVNHGDGTWSADNVPVYGQGTATFDANAASASGQAAENSSLEMGFYMTTVLYHYTENEATSTQAPGHGDTLWTWSWDKTCQSTLPTNGSQPFQAGSGTERFSANEFSPNGYTQNGEMDCAWSDYEDGHFHITNNVYGGKYADDDYYSQPEFEYYGYNPEAGYDEATPQNNIYYANTSYSWDGGTDAGMTYARLMSLNVKTQVKLWTGGKATVQRQSLFGVQCSATELLQPVLGTISWPWAGTMPAWPSDLAYQWQSEPSAPIDLTRLEILGTHPGADGMVWKALPDNSVQDLTITAPGKKHYSAWATPQKYKVNINANNGTDHDLDNEKPEFCVGQKVTFTLNGLPGNVVDMVGGWSLPGKYVNQPTNYSATCQTYVNNGDLLRNTNQTACWFVNKPGGSVSVGLNLKFDNGQMTSIARDGKFTVYRPTTTFNPIYHGTPQVIITNNYLALGQNRYHDMSFRHYIQSDFPGLAGYTQLCNGYDKRDATISTDGDELDNTEWARGQQTINNTEVASLRRAFFFDAPQVPLSILATTTKMHWSYRTYLRFKPDGDGSIFVTLRLATWGLDASASYSGGWNIDSGSSCSGPSDSDNTDFPVWMQIFFNSILI